MKAQITTTPVKVIDFNLARKAFVLQNQGSVPVFFAFRPDVAASGANTGLKLEEGESWVSLSNKDSFRHDFGTNAVWAVAPENAELVFEELTQ